MEANARWISGISFEAEIRDHRFKMDAKLESGGQNLGPSPKELLLAGIAGCAGMDVASLLKKMRVDFENLKISAESELTKIDPKVFIEVHVKFFVTGTNVAADKVKKAVEMSMTKYCGVSAMIIHTCPIKYQIIINEQITHEGEAHFDSISQS